MSEVWWPPTERVKYLGFLSAPDAAWLAVAVAAGVAGILTQVPIHGGVAALLLALWGRGEVAGTRVRTRFARWVRWRRRTDREWTSPLQGKSGRPVPMLRDVSLAMVVDNGVPVGVVECRTRSLFGAVTNFTVMLPVSCRSVTFAGDAEQAARFAAWGDVLSDQCVERGEHLAAERIAWTDVHRAANPHALRGDHQRHGQPGPAADDYLEYVTGFSEVAADHQVVVSVTVSNAQLGVARSKGGFMGSPADVMRAAAVSVARGVRSQLAGRGFEVGELFRPAEIGRLIVEAGDPFEPRRDKLSSRERFGLPDRTGPESVSVARREVAIDSAFHRTFQIVWPRTAVDQNWMWRVLGVEGPKIVTTVYEPVAPSVADRERDGRANRQRANSVIVANRRGGEESMKDQRKRAALRAAEAAVAGGHDELDCWAIVVVSARSTAELNSRSERLREALRVSGKASVRELTGLHDVGFRLALPIGAFAGATRE